MMKNIELYPQQQISIPNIATTPSFKLLVRSIVTLGVCSGLTIPVSAQVTAGGDSTSINQSGNTFNIRGGTQPTGTNNLFHSFGKFDLNINQTANFDLKSGQPANVQSGANIQNILGRINGGQPSSIDGTIQVTGGNATGVNLYLMNPAGIVFGKNASLDINGAFTATTARAIDFGNGNWFNALGANIYTELKGNPIGFAFPGSTSGSIFSAATFDASPLDPNNSARILRETARPGQSITLVGGTVISTGDIKTVGGNISIATVEGGKYVKIKSEGSILSLNLPIDLQPENAKNIAADATAFTPPLLPVLLTGDTTKTLATGVTVEPNNVVKLVGDNRAISPGDIVTKNIDTSGDIVGGNLSLSTQTGNIITSNINTKSVGQSDFDKSKIYDHRGGKVFLKTQAGDIFVDSIDTSGNNTSGGGSKGGDVAIDAGGLFRAIGSINTGGNGARVDDISSINNGRIDDSLSTLGTINITHQGTSFVFGAQVNINPQPGGGNTITLTKDFKFPEGASGTGGAILSRNTNGNLQVVFNDKGFQSSTGFSPGFQITAVKPPVITPVTPVITPVTPVITTVTPPITTVTSTSGQTETPAGEGTATQTGGKTGTQVANQTSNPDTQAANQTSKQDCNLSSTSVVANSTTDPTRSEGNASAPSADPCQLVTGTAGGTLQILNNKN